MHDDHILSVSALTASLKRTLEGAFPFVWVRGQVVNLARPSSGHLYFSLRDETSSLAAVWFKGSQQAGERFDPLTGEVYEEGPRPSLAHSLDNGQEIVCAGRIAVYGARGVYQLVVELAQEAGLGRLHEEFERLRARLEQQGYFAAERKRPLPAHPSRVAVVTAPRGAAIHDFLRLAEQRGLGAHIRIYPTPVQGDGAAPAMIAALGRIRAEGWAEVIVLIRGGGSIEDLWAFNDADLARAILEAPVPVLAGVGHEVDVTLADMTADVRAATPSHAAQLLWPERAELYRQWRVLHGAFEQAQRRYLEGVRQRLAGLTRELAWRSPQRLIEARAERLAGRLRLLHSAALLALQREEGRLHRFSAGLLAAPERVPAQEARFVGLRRRLADAALRGIEKKTAMLAEAARAVDRAPDALPPRDSLVALLQGRLESAGRGLVEEASYALEREHLRLEGLNPHAPLQRGYALVRKADGIFVKKTGDVAPEERLELLVSDGAIPVRVEAERSPAFEGDE